jgi:hypothetical protein
MMIEYKRGAMGNLKRYVLTTLGREKNLTFAQRAHYGLIERPAYAYCIYHAAELAARLGIPKISILEFGVAGGNGLVAIENITEAIRATENLPVEFEIYGFDTGTGMPPPTCAEDLPYWFQESQYRMDEERLRSRLRFAELVIGDVKDTAPRFHENFEHAPIGAIMIDVDYYSSTNDCLSIFRTDDVSRHFLPRVFLYLDDILGQSIEMYGPQNGMLRSIDEFNSSTDAIKIHRNQNLMPISHLRYRYQIYYAHLFQHAQYSTYVGGRLQEAMQKRLQLKR